MQAVPSFAPLAARLAARADEIRPADGAAASWANLMALFWCAIYQMLIALCEALDARAAADARLAAPAIREGAARPAAVIPGRKLPVAARAARLALAPDAKAISPERDAVSIVRPEFAGPWLAWSRHPGPAWAVAGPPSAVPPKKSASRQGTKHVIIVTITQLNPDAVMTQGSHTNPATSLDRHSGKHGIRKSCCAASRMSNSILPGERRPGDSRRQPRA